MEEVKHVLKPHFLRKYITKDDYKEIMKKSVSKVSGIKGEMCVILIFNRHCDCFSLQICNSRSGEINPQKIKAFIDAYVKKYRYKRKHGASGGVAGGASVATTSTSATGTTSSSVNVSTGGVGVSNQNK